MVSYRGRPYIWVVATIALGDEDDFRFSCRDLSGIMFLGGQQKSRLLVAPEVDNRRPPCRRRSLIVYFNGITVSGISNVETQLTLIACGGTQPRGCNYNLPEGVETVRETHFKQTVSGN